MSDNKKKVFPWSPEQRAALDMRDRTVLLSAAAGAGKTQVLKERIILAVTDPENPLDLSRLLAVTFTRAATRELRERIAKALAEQVQAHPGDTRLLRQLRMLPMAKICTIDSFCGDLVRRFATRAGVSDGYRVADQQETDLTRLALMERLLERAYAGLIPDLSAADFADFSTRLFSLKEERSMGDTLLSLIERLETMTDGIATLLTHADAYRRDAEIPLMETSWGKLILSYCREIGSHFLQVLNAAVVPMPENPKLSLRYEAYLADYREVIEVLVSPHASYAALRSLITKKFISSPDNFKNVAPTLKAALDDLRTNYIKGDTFSKFFSYEEAEWTSLFTSLAHYTEILYKLARAFIEMESAESRRRGVYSFAQIERLAYNLLIQNGEKTDLARSVAAEYSAVAVDEYQDVSPLQHAVFEAVSGERARFLVGDIKQSIYRFRHADPSIFAGLRREFPDPLVAPLSPTASLFLTRNFRCDKPVVDYVNHVFDTLFGVCGESIGYTRSDRLGFGKHTAGIVFTARPTLAVFESCATGFETVAAGATMTNGLPDAAHVLGGEKNPAPDPDREFDDEEEIDMDIHREAMWVASTIRDLLDNAKRGDGRTPIYPRDIVILLRSKRDKVMPYIEALRAYQIPANTPETVDFFSCPEVLLTLSLLRVIDNPIRDIPLAAVLLSPLWGFTPDELTLIRRAAPPYTPLYTALRAWCEEHDDFMKGKKFLTQLASFREVAKNVSVDRLMRRLMSETPLVSIAGKDGNGGDAKIRLLYHYALRRSGGEESLYDFIRYINHQIESGKTFAPPGAVENADAVTVMTIHSAKGLEAPVVFLADCGKQFSREDCKNHFVFDGHRPVAFRLRDKSGLIREENPVRGLVCRTLTEENAEEEMRLLYVALTRAKERLYISGTLPAKTTLADALQKARQDAHDISRFSVLRRNSYLSLAILCYERDRNYCDFLANPTPLPLPLAKARDRVTEDVKEEELADLAARYRELFGYRYSHEILTHIPGKLSVSRLSPALLDATESETTHLDTPSAIDEAAATDTYEKHLRLPEAYTRKKRVAPTELGIATHKFMQFCDFESLARDGVEAELQRLVDREFLSEEDAALVRRDELHTFLRTPLFAAMREAKEVKREFRFHVHLPASLFTSAETIDPTLDGEMLLVQGVMDAVIIDPAGEITLVDYKTDRLPKALREIPGEAEEELLLRHACQLRYYAAAAEKIFGKAPRRVAIYSLQLGKCIDLRLD